jgi:lipoate-protein ligase A
LQWRFISDGEHGGSWNMAMDEAILDAVEGGIAPATLRIYTWEEPSVTVGRHQDVRAGVDLAFCEAHSVPIVRRPTGGRGILHGADLTVSLVLPLDALPIDKRSVIESYRYLSTGFLNALRTLGLEGVMGECDSRSGRGGDCFAVRSAADVVTVAGQKLIGSAQRRRGGFLLQQSSIRYRRTEARTEDVFRGQVEQGRFPLENVTGNLLAQAVRTGFQQLFGAEPEMQTGPTGWEEERCGTLVCAYAPLRFTAG